MKHIEADGNPHSPDKARPLHVCGAGCGCKLVSPLKIDTETPFIQYVDENQWQMILLCPDCGNVEEDVYTTEQVDAYAEHMTKERREIRTSARVLSLEIDVENFETMTADDERDLRAFYDHNFLPEDFLPKD